MFTKHFPSFDFRTFFCDEIKILGDLTVNSFNLYYSKDL